MVYLFLFSSVAGNDYVGISMSLRFLDGNHRICTEVNITNDNETEPTESFLIFLTTTDTTVVMDLQFAYVYIIGKLLVIGVYQLVQTQAPSQYHLCTSGC